MLTVPARPKNSKSRSASRPRCPTCGGPLVLTADSPDLTTYTCPKCAKAQVAEWVGTETAARTIKKLARKYKGLACVDVDDLQGEIALALLEHPLPVIPTAERFWDWLDVLAKSVAGGQRDEFLKHSGPRLGEWDGMVADTTPDEDEAVAQAKADEARRKRIERALHKLTEAQRNAVRERYFRRSNLAGLARASGRCDSAERTNLWRAHKRLAELVDESGYAVLAA